MSVVKSWELIYDQLFEVCNRFIIIVGFRKPYNALSHELRSESEEANSWVHIYQRTGLESAGVESRESRADASSCWKLVEPEIPLLASSGNNSFLSMHAGVRYGCNSAFQKQWTNQMLWWQQS